MQDSVVSNVVDYLPTPGLASLNGLQEMIDKASSDLAPTAMLYGAAGGLRAATSMPLPD